jgi:hypothetical protein
MGMSSSSGSRGNNQVAQAAQAPCAVVLSLDSGSCDVCPLVVDDEQNDTDKDRQGDACGMCVVS